MRIKILVLMICCSFLIIPDVYAVSRKKLNDRIERAVNYLEEVMEIPDTRIPSSLLRKSHGVVIIRQYKIGFIFGVKGGKGVALKRDKKTGEWSAPSFVTSVEGSVGFQAGAQAIDAILLIMNKNGLESLLKAKCKLGLDASVAVGPYGRDAEAKIGPDTAFLVYATANGLFAGLSLEGGILTQDNGANEKFYGIEDVSVKEIFNNEVTVPDEAKELIKLLEEYCKEIE
ncbi:MAG: lipid-binding SYLF domain-containing protein [Candidatus Scalindua sp.]